MIDCRVAQTIIGIAMAEMMHLENLGLIITLLGGVLDYTTIQNMRSLDWSPKFISISRNPKEMILLDIQAEKDAIAQYRRHMQVINDAYFEPLTAHFSSMHTKMVTLYLNPAT